MSHDLERRQIGPKPAVLVDGLPLDAETTSPDAQGEKAIALRGAASGTRPRVRSRVASASLTLRGSLFVQPPIASSLVERALVAYIHDIKVLYVPLDIAGSRTRMRCFFYKLGSIVFDQDVSGASLEDAVTIGRDAVQKSGDSYDAFEVRIGNRRLYREGSVVHPTKRKRKRLPRQPAARP